MRIAIVKYNAGNTASVANALSRLGVEAVITDEAEVLIAADKVIFPGVGEASSAMNHLRKRGLAEIIKSLRQPVLGICLGMQLLCASSEENGADCLGVLPYTVRRFNGDGLKLLHTGWNKVSDLRSPLFDGIAEGEHFYFVHGYFVKSGKDTTATCVYGETFSAALQRENFYAVQFHPEKSGVVGGRVLENFLTL
ncbi:MAG: imidazole glycerol phosphate synthase subunit HisH [Pyrinomonadaceae bacterium]